MKHSRLVAGLIPALVALVPFVALGGEREVETKYTRFLEKGQKGKLETGVGFYKSANSDVEIILYGVVHIADKAYFKQVQKDLDSYDVVLFEGVGGPKDMAKDEPKPDESMATIGELQTTMGKLMGLTFQKDGIDYKNAKNFVHADMTLEQLQKATGGDMSKALPGAGLFQDPNTMKMIKPMLKMLKGMGSALPAEMRDMLKMQMARQLGNVDLSAIPGGGDVQKILVGERNKVCMEVLEKELKKRTSGRIAIFYGAAHMKDFHERLEKLGWEQKSHEWRTAWNIGGKQPADDDRDDEKPSTDEEKPAPRRTPTTTGKRRWL